MPPFIHLYMIHDYDICPPPHLSLSLSHTNVSFPTGLHTTTTMYNLRRRTKLLLSLLPTSALLLILLFSNTHLKNSNSNIPKTHVHNHIQLADHSACQDTLYKDLCVSTLSTFPDLTTKSVPQIISYTVSHTVSEVQASSSNCTGIIKKQFKKLDAHQQIALDDCLELFDDTIAELQEVISDLSIKKLSSNRYYDLKTLLSGAMTNQYTCLDGFNDTGIVRHEIESRLQTISQHVSNALVMLKKIPGALKYENSKLSTSSEMFPEFGPMKNGFPAWFSSKDRKLLQSGVNGTKYDLVVAKDGTGNFTTISEAVAVAPNSSATR